MVSLVAITLSLWNISCGSTCTGLITVDNNRCSWCKCNSLPFSLKWQLIYALPTHRINDQQLWPYEHWFYHLQWCHLQYYTKLDPDWKDSIPLGQQEIWKCLHCHIVSWNCTILCTCCLLVWYCVPVSSCVAKFISAHDGIDGSQLQWVDFLSWPNHDSNHHLFWGFSWGLIQWQDQRKIYKWYRLIKFYNVLQCVQFFK